MSESGTHYHVSEFCAPCYLRWAFMARAVDSFAGALGHPTLTGYSQREAPYSLRAIVKDLASHGHLHRDLRPFPAAWVLNLPCL